MENLLKLYFVDEKLTQIQNGTFNMDPFELNRLQKAADITEIFIKELHSFVEQKLKVGHPDLIAMGMALYLDQIIELNQRPEEMRNVILGIIGRID